MREPTRRNPHETVADKRKKIPTDAPADRASAGSSPQIVILVVVGSSPISHPTE